MNPEPTNHRTPGKRTDERGYALALTALLLIPLLSFAAIGVDIGVWYLQAQRNQRVADAAALATYREAFPDLRIEIDGLVVADDATVLEFTLPLAPRMKSGTPSWLRSPIPATEAPK